MHAAQPRPLRIRCGGLSVHQPGNLHLDNIIPSEFCRAFVFLLLCFWALGLGGRKKGRTALLVDPFPKAIEFLKGKGVTKENLPVRLAFWAHRLPQLGAPIENPKAYLIWTSTSKLGMDPNRVPL